MKLLIIIFPFTACFHAKRSVTQLVSSQTLAFLYSSQLTRGCRGPPAAPSSPRPWTPQRTPPTTTWFMWVKMVNDFRLFLHTASTVTALPAIGFIDWQVICVYCTARHTRRFQSLFFISFVLLFIIFDHFSWSSNSLCTTWVESRQIL